MKVTIEFFGINFDRKHSVAPDMSPARHNTMFNGRHCK